VKKVLIVDDDMICRDSVGEHLIKEGFEPLKAASGHEALKIFKEGLLDVVIIDLNMPEMSGMETLLELKKLSLHVPMIMLTGYWDIPTAVKAVKCGAFDFLTKPPDFDILLSILEDAIEQKSQRDICLLTSRQREILEYVSQGKISSEIAKTLQVKEETVKFHLDKAMTKLNAKNRIEAVSIALYYGLIDFKPTPL